MSVADLFQLTGATLAICMVALWLLSLALRDASIVDIFWGLGFVVIAVVTGFATTEGDSVRRGAIVALTAIWGLRLGGYLYWRSRGGGEDPRYVAMRRDWGARFWWVSLFTVFAFQGVVMWVVSLPVQLGLLDAGGPLGVLDGLGIALWGLGLAFETIGDWQLAKFKADPSSAGQVMDRGLWRYSRHPNYFGDFCVWWGIFAIALSTVYGAWSVIGPALMTFMLLRVSGVAMLERSIHKRRPEYVEYAKRTSRFFPRPPRMME